jgi:hypothetical protein
MNYSAFTDKALQIMHDAVHRAIADDAVAAKRGDPPRCGTKETKDWHSHAQGLEDELARRNVPFYTRAILGNARRCGATFAVDAAGLQPDHRR